MPTALRANVNKAEAKFNVVTEFSNFDLHSAAATGNIGLVEYALTRGQPVNSVIDGVLPLHTACAGGNEHVVKLLIEHGADVNAPRLPRKYSNDRYRDASAPIVGTTGSTPLHFAAANGNKNIIKTLLLKGARPDRADKYNVIPETLARQNGWLECAEILRTWAENRDRDLRERQAPAPFEDQSSPIREKNDESYLPGSSSTHTRKRLQVKRSIDTALNMLKVSSNCHESTLRPPPLSPIATSVAASPPTSPIRSPSNESFDYGYGRYTPSPSPIEPPSGGRRPSLPHIFPTPQVRPPAKPTTLTKPARRPRSAGNGAEPEHHPSFGRGGAGRVLGSKYSLVNIFKKSQSDVSQQHMATASTGSSSFTSAPGSSYFATNTPSSSNIQLEDSPASSTTRPSGRFHKESSSSNTYASTPPQSKPISITTPFYSQHQHMPSAVDMHNALAQHRDVAGSSTSLLHSGLGLSFDDTSGSPGSSPKNRIGVLRARPPGHGHIRNRSGSGSSFLKLEQVDDDGEQIGKKERSRPGILRTHNRAPSIGGQSPGSMRALRFDSTSSPPGVAREVESPPALRGSSSTNSFVRPVGESPKLYASHKPEDSVRIPDSAPATVSNFETSGDPDNNDDDDDEDYGVFPSDIPKHQPPARRRGPSFASSSQSSLSPILTHNISENSIDREREFPFSIDHEVSIEGASPRLRPPLDVRSRGDSFSSLGTVDSQTNPYLSTSGTTNSGSGTGPVNTPILPTESDLPTSPPRKGHELLPFEDDMFTNQGGINERRGNDRLDIDVKRVSSHAQAEALVLRAQQDILKMGNSGAVSTEASSEGWTPLSARLAAYGESLALEKKLREEKVQRAGQSAFVSDRDPSSQQTTHARPLNDSSSSMSNLNRQLSLKSSPSPQKTTKAPRRPHTASGVTSTPSIVPGGALSSSVKSQSFMRSSPARSAPVKESMLPDIEDDLDSLLEPQQPTRSAVVRHAPEIHSRANSMDGYDSSVGHNLTRTTTNPLPSNVRSPPIRGTGNVSKLARMGFTGFNPPDQTARQATASPKRFGIKGLVRSLKGKT